MAHTHIARAPHRMRLLPLLLTAVLCLALRVTNADASRIHLRVGSTAQPSSPSQQQHNPPKLPVFFFHGLTGNATSGANLGANLTADGRIFHALSFCVDACSASSLNRQVQLAIEQVRAIVANATAAYANGYIFVGHSQGGTIARAVVELMDDHNVRALVSLAGAQNGIFYGPQPSDAMPALAFAKRIGPSVIAPALFDFAKYTPSDFASGTFQLDFNAFVLSEHPELQEQVSVLALARSPLGAVWADSNPFLPRINNIAVCKGFSAGEVDQYDDGYSNSRSKKKQACEAEQARRHANFAKLQQAHFFGSPADETVAPWQSAILGKYEDVATERELRDRFRDLQVLNITRTPEFVNNTYGLRTLHDRGDALFLHTVHNVSHSCWVADSTPPGATAPCLFKRVYDEHVFPVFRQADAAAAAKPRTLS